MEYSDSRLVTHWEGHRQFGSRDRPSTPSIPCPSQSNSLPLELGLVTKGLSLHQWLEPRRGRITEQFCSIGTGFTAMASLMHQLMCTLTYDRVLCVCVCFSKDSGTDGVSCRERFG